MPRLSITVPHNLGTEEALRRLRERYDAVKARYGQELEGLEGRWEGDTLHCRLETHGLTIQGTVTAEPQYVHVNANLPLAAMMFKGVVTKRVRDELEKILG